MMTIVYCLGLLIVMLDTMAATSSLPRAPRSASRSGVLLWRCAASAWCGNEVAACCRGCRGCRGPAEKPTNRRNGHQSMCRFRSHTRRSRLALLYVRARRPGRAELQPQSLRLPACFHSMLFTYNIYAGVFYNKSSHYNDLPAWRPRPRGRRAASSAFTAGALCRDEAHPLAFDTPLCACTNQRCLHTWPPRIGRRPACGSHC